MSGTTIRDRNYYAMPKGQIDPFWLPISNAPSDLLEAALYYAACGWRVFPCREKPGWVKNKKDKFVERKAKSPRINAWQIDATTDPATIKAWWKRWPRSLSGISTGKGSRIFCVDLDCKEPSPGEDIKRGIDTWEVWLGEYGNIETLNAETPGDGQHRIFKYVEGVRNVPLHQLRDGIEIKGEGGYIVVVPGYGSEHYRWTNHMPVADAPQ
jgi:hypothetical protein